MSFKSDIPHTVEICCTYTGRKLLTTQLSHHTRFKRPVPDTLLLHCFFIFFSESFSLFRHYFLRCTIETPCTVMAVAVVHSYTMAATPWPSFRLCGVSLSGVHTLHTSPSKPLSSSPQRDLPLLQWQPHVAETLHAFFLFADDRVSQLLSSSGRHTHTKNSED